VTLSDAVLNGLAVNEVNNTNSSYARWSQMVRRFAGSGRVD
jgi:hypothetical protein